MSDFYCDQVLSGLLRITVLEENDEVLAFEHTKPAYERHVVVVPKNHVSDLVAADADLLAVLLPVVQRQAQLMTQSSGACRVITNLGAYQDSKHLHWHVVSGART